MSKLASSGAQSSRIPVKSRTTPAVSARVQGAVAKQNGGGVPKGSYIGRLQHAAADSPKCPNSQLTSARETMSQQSGNDNRSKQLNPNHDEYWRSRGEDKRPDNWERRIA